MERVDDEAKSYHRPMSDLDKVSNVSRLSNSNSSDSRLNRWHLQCFYKDPIPPFWQMKPKQSECFASWSIRIIAERPEMVWSYEGIVRGTIDPSSLWFLRHISWFAPRWRRPAIIDLRLCRFAFEHRLISLEFRNESGLDARWSHDNRRSQSKFHQHQRWLHRVLGVSWTTKPNASRSKPKRDHFHLVKVR